MGNYTIFWMFENPRRGRRARNFTTNVPKILDLKSSSEQIFSENWRWVPPHCAYSNLAHRWALITMVLVLAHRHKFRLWHRLPITGCTINPNFFYIQQEKNRINKEGELVISSTKYRTQFKNLEDAIQKLETIIEDASFVPKETTPEKKACVRKL